MNRPRRNAPPPDSRLTIHVYWGVRAKPASTKRLERVARHVAAAEGFRDGALSIAVVGARRMARLHLETTGIPGPTDVLTFDLGCDVRRGCLDGEIVVCRDVAAKAARTVGARAVERELALYVTHGILHLAGYDDHTPADYARMHAREDELLRAQGLGSVFARSASKRGKGYGPR